jgi:hypothetical protein
MTKSDIRLAEERVKRLEKEVKLFKLWFEKGSETRRKIVNKMKIISDPY